MREFGLQTLLTQPSVVNSMRSPNRFLPVLIAVFLALSAFSAHRAFLLRSNNSDPSNSSENETEAVPGIAAETAPAGPSEETGENPEAESLAEPEESADEEATVDEQDGAQNDDLWDQPGFAETRVFQDGIEHSHSAPDFSRDVKTLSKNAETQRLVNYPAGYMLDFPADMRTDFSLSPAFVRVSGSDLDIKISRERSPYADVESYLKDYPNRFMARADFAVYRDRNRIELFEDDWIALNGRKLRLVGVKRSPAGSTNAGQNEYLLAYILAGGTDFYALHFRSDSIDKARPRIDAILNSFETVKVRGSARFALGLKPRLGDWNAETLEYYDRLVDGTQFVWGIFHPWALTDSAQYEYIANIESALGYRFPIVLHYLYAAHDFPLEQMREAYARGQTVELTMQVANFDNEASHVANANFDLLDGLLDAQLREFARDAARFGHPFLFRLNNEMNTDWAQYSGVKMMCDPDLYVEVWRRIYRIFEEEGVNNAIWVFNPNHRSYPPMNWNHHLSYFPGNEYVHVIGLTGYNTGTYFRQVTGETWASFRQIYDPVVSQYRGFYSEFPWIITEFASSSVGGDKSAWIDEMFKALPRYPEIKAAVWWSYADYDYRPGNEEIPARRYWLDEEPEHLESFRRGLLGQGLVNSVEQ